MAANQNEVQKALIQTIPPSMYYLPGFLTAEEEASILAAVSHLPQKSWTTLAHRRLLSLPSQLTGTRRDTLIEGSMPEFLLNPVVTRLVALEIFKASPHSSPNHCLVNEYCAGQGIMPHEDGPAYHPITATVSLGSHTVLDIYKKSELGERGKMPTWRILQEPRSLLITTDEVYRNTLHGIQESELDKDLGVDTIANWSLLGDHLAYEHGHATRVTRLSLTFRDVLKVSKLGGALKFMTKR